eukprot:13372107-Heterocapsa_arctica.AAC.1
MVRIVANAITGGVNRGVLGMVAPIGGDDGGGDATATPVRRQALGFGVPLAEEGAQRADRAPYGRHEGRLPG